MKRASWPLFYLFLSCVVFAANKVELLDLLDPAAIHVDGNQMYITEHATIYIYSTKDYHLIKKFGRRGEGPKEFKLGEEDQVDLFVLPGYLQINSEARVSFFTKDGNYIKEISTLHGRWLRPLGKNFVGMRPVFDEKNIRYHVVNLYDSNCNKVKEIYREKAEIQHRRQTFNAVSWTRDIYHNYREKIFVDGKNKVIRVFDNKGEKLYDINLKYDRIKITDEIKNKYLKYYRENPFWRQRWERLKKWYIFPDYLPVVQDFVVKDERIYILTYKEENDKFEFLVLDIKGKLLKKVFLPLVKSSYIWYYPWDISKGKLYKIVEKEDSERYELHVDEIN